MDRLLKAAAILELATGVALMIVPSPVARLLLGVELTGVAVVLSRVAGIALSSLGIACFPSRESLRAASSAMLTYNLLITIFLLYLGVRGEWAGVLLWPVAALHAILTTLLARASLLGGAARRS